MQIVIASQFACVLAVIALVEIIEIAPHVFVVLGMLLVLLGIVLLGMLLVIVLREMVLRVIVLQGMVLVVLRLIVILPAHTIFHNRGVLASLHCYTF